MSRTGLAGVIALGMFWFSGCQSAPTSPRSDSSEVRPGTPLAPDAKPNTAALEATRRDDELIKSLIGGQVEIVGVATYGKGPSTMMIPITLNGMDARPMAVSVAFPDLRGDWGDVAGDTIRVRGTLTDYSPIVAMVKFADGGEAFVQTPSIALALDPVTARPIESGLPEYFAHIQIADPAKDIEILTATGTVEALVGTDVTVVGTAHASKNGPLLLDVGLNGLCADGIIIEFPEGPDKELREETWAAANDGQKVRARGKLVSYQPMERGHLGHVQLDDPVSDLTPLTDGGDLEGIRLESLVDSQIVLEGTVDAAKHTLYVHGRVNGVPAHNMCLAFSDAAGGFEAADDWGTRNNGKSILVRGVLKHYGYRKPARFEQSRGEGYYGTVTIADPATDIQVLTAESAADDHTQRSK